MKLLVCILLGVAIGFPASLPATGAPPDPATPAAPVPAEADIEQAEKTIRDVHKADYAKKKPAEQVDLARKMLKEADETTDNPAARFVLYREARDLAARGGDVPLALEAVDATARAFAVKPPDLAYTALDAAEKARVAPGRVVAEAALDATETAIRADDYPTADRLLKLAIGAGGRAASAPGLTATVAARAKEVEAIRKAFEATEADRKTLQANPADPGPNARVGRFLCLLKGDWAAGLPLLLKGDDEKLKVAAELEQGKPVKGEDMAALADRWWDLSGGLAAGERGEARVRA
ncbi:MAG: hypothetical protein JWO38_3074 [Gemmataceae bacterium]|nr:hypothetical protein [Gemmataceae bacterium]